MPTFLIPANNPAPNPIVPNGVNEFIRPSMDFTPIVPRSTKNFTKSELTTVEDNCSTAELNCDIFKYIQPNSQNLTSC